jgi:hypothetical protein
LLEVLAVVLTKAVAVVLVVTKQIMVEQLYL